MSNAIRTLLLLICSMTVLVATGCGRSGPPRVAVRGAILFENQMLKSGRITFTPVEGSKGPAAVAVVTDGFYAFDWRTGPVVGKHRVQIESILNPGFELDDESAYAKAAQQQTGRAVLPPQSIPLEFNERSKLVVTVTPVGETKLDFSL